MNKTGNLSINSENIFPIIKKWLYSDKDIFLRELVSNGCDAVTKLKKLAGIGSASIDADEKFKVTVSIFKDAKKLVISDNGIGMTADNVLRVHNSHTPHILASDFGHQFICKPHTILTRKVE